MITKFSSNSTEKYGISRVAKDIKYVWDYIIKESNSGISQRAEPNNESNPERLNLISTAYLFTLLGYLSKQGYQSDEEKNLFYDMWTLLKGEESGGVTFDSIKKIILTIHGYHKGTIKQVPDEADLESEIVYKRIGNIMNEDLTD